MAKKSLVIVVNDRISRISEVVYRNGREGRRSVASTVVFPTPEGAVTDGVVHDPESLGAAIRKALDDNGIKSKSAAFSIVSSRVAVRDVSIPAVKDTRIKSIITTNASEYFPVDLADYELGYSVIEKTTNAAGGSSLRVMIYAIPLSLIRGYFNLAAAANLKLQLLDYAGNSQYNAIKELAPQGVTMYICLDNASTYITFISEGNLSIQRTLTFGGDDFVNDYLSATNRGGAAYIDAIEELSGPDGEALAVKAMGREAVSESLSRIISGISRSLDYYNANNYEKFVDKAVLCGYCGKLALARDSIAAATSLPTILMEDEPGVEKVFSNPTESSRAINSIGACIAPLDIMPAQFAAQGKKRKVRSSDVSLVSGVVIAALLALVSAALLFSSFTAREEARQERDRVEREINSLVQYEEAYQTYISYTSAADALVAVRTSNETPNDDLVAFLEELEEKLPSRITLLSMSCTKTHVILNMTAPTKEQAAAVLVQLRTFESLSSLGLASILETEDETGGSYVSFSITCEYGPNPYFGGDAGEEVQE